MSPFNEGDQVTEDDLLPPNDLDIPFVDEQSAQNILQIAMNIAGLHQPPVPDHQTPTAPPCQSSMESQAIDFNLVYCCI